MVDQVPLEQVLAQQHLEELEVKNRSPILQSQPTRKQNLSSVVTAKGPGGITCHDIDSSGQQFSAATATATELHSKYEQLIAKINKSTGLQPDDGKQDADGRGSQENDDAETSNEHNDALKRLYDASV